MLFSLCFKAPIITTSSIGFIFPLFFQSCCKLDCSDDDKIGIIRFEGYTKKDIDSTKILKYKKGTAFATAIDTFYVTSIMVNDYTNETDISIPTEQHYIDVNYDYKLLLNTGTEYALTEFILESQKSKCNAFGKGCWHLELISYKINGQVVNKSYLWIIK